MALHYVRIDAVAPFDYEFGGNIPARMADIGRTIGSQAIGLTIQTVAPGCRSSRRHRHVFQEEILIVMAGTGTLLHGEARIPVRAGDCFCYRPDDAELHAFENAGSEDLVIWAFGNRFRHEVCLYPDEGIAFVEGLGAEVPLADVVESAWTEERRQR
ncbi:Cupin domain-containing protein [Rhizobiales bacterium GAS191]|nr:Cupin domain-containing protein [Rhizobiales bacterium GAS191]